VRLGAAVQAEKGDGEAHGFKGPVCFEVPSDYEITVGGRKLLGSAQTRRNGIVLQHGALPLYGDLGRICDVLAFYDKAEREDARQRLLRRAITVEEALGDEVGLARAVGAMMAGFCDALNLQLEEGELSAAEIARADELRAMKYATDEWTRRS
jgi:lipoyl(octanoyl) transferase